SQLEQIRIDLDLQDCVAFAGNLPKEAIKENLDLSDALVVSSLEETFGVAVIEALSRGCPVIATKSGGPEFILTDEFGILIERGNQDELSNALKRMVSERTSFSRTGMRDFAISKFGSKT